MLAAVLLPGARPFVGSTNYGPAFVGAAALLWIAVLIAYFEAEEHPHLYYFSAGSNGVVQAMVTIFSGRLIRPSSLTGPFTDIAIIVGQILRGNTKKVWLLQVLLAVVTSFAFGSFVSFWARSEPDHRFYGLKPLILPGFLGSCVRPASM